jgi:Concanavalin A-like lectin/glucanases superfamily
MAGRKLNRRWRAGLGAVLVSAALGAGASSAAAAPATLGEWRFDEPGGQLALDSGPFGLDGRLGESQAPEASDPQRIAGLSGGALRFDGQSFVRLPDSDALAAQSLTAEAVVRAPDSPGQWRYIVSRGSVRCFAGSYGLYTGAAGGIAFYVFDGSRYVVSAGARPQDVWDGAWHHVGATFDGTALRLFVDGRPVGEPAIRPMQIDYASTTMSAAFGRYVGDCDLAFDGDLDMARLWSVALSPGAIATSAARELHPGVDDPPVGLLDPLPAATPPQVVDARAPASPGGKRPAAEPGAPPRACAMRLSRTRIPARRRTVVRVRVTLRGRPARAVRVTVKRRGRLKPISSAHTGARGRARLVLQVRRPGRVRITAAIRPSCAPGFIRVARRR